MQQFENKIECSNIEITDSLFRYYVNLIPEVVIPYQWNILNDQLKDAKVSKCLNNFKIAAKETDGEFFGTVFIDTDVYKWIEAASYCIESKKSLEYEKIIDDVIQLIAKAQQDDGYIVTYYIINKNEKRWSNLIEGHELYCAGHLIEAAVAYYYATNKKDLLNIAMRFSDLIIKKFGTGENQIPGYPGHQEIELALVKLYRATKNEKYLKQALYFITQRGAKPNYFTNEIKKRNNANLFAEFHDYSLKYSQCDKSVYEQDNIEGHAVRAMYMCSAMADLALEYKDQKLLDVCKNLWDSTTNKKMYITGGIGSSGYLERFTVDYDLPNDDMYCETCASVGLMMFGQRMNKVTKNAKYYDQVEAALYNTVLGGINADGIKYFYVNPLEVLPKNCINYSSMQHVKPVRQKWFDVACCPTNIARTLASINQYIYQIEGDTLYINQFISSKYSNLFNNEQVNLVMENNYENFGKITIKVDNEVKIKVRIPNYANNPIFILNSKNISVDIENNYANLVLEKSDELFIDFNIVPRFVAANDLVKSDTLKVALKYGPFVYCLEEVDNSSNLFSIAVKSDTQIKNAGKLDSLPGGLPKFEYEGYRIKSNVKNLYGVPEFTKEKINLTAIPYCLWCNREFGEMLVWQKLIL